MWIFGYGSLIWKTDFPYELKLVGCIKGYARRFWQASEDHRGIPGKPGRVVTIVPSENSEECVWGIAYKVADKDKERVNAYLDFREKDGYEKVSVAFYPQDRSVEAFDLILYIGTVNNPYFLGPACKEEIAQQIYSACGLSGENKEYLFELAHSMRLLVPDVEDKHLFELEAEVLKLCRSDQNFNGT